MDQLNAMRAFIRVVDTGSFTRAADLLGMPRPTLTKLIQSLERHLRVKLLQRTTRRVSVTQHGAWYYEQTQALLGTIEDIDGQLQASQYGPTGLLRVHAGASIASHLLIPALPEFCARFPNIEIDLGIADRFVSLVGENVDCVVRGGDPNDPNLIARPIGAAPWITCATPEYLNKHGRPSHPHDLQTGHRLIAYTLPNAPRNVPLKFIQGNERYEIHGNAAVRVNESNAHTAAGLTGLGIVQTFAFHVRAYIASGTLEPILSEWQPEPYHFFAAYHPNRYASTRQRAFIDWLIERFPQLLS